MLRRSTARVLSKLQRMVQPPPPPVAGGEKDDHIAWLRYANAGMILQGNISSLEYALSNLPSDSPAVEIGSFCGLSTNLITYFLARAGKSNRLFTCDRWMFEGSETGGNLSKTSPITHAQYRTFVMETYQRNVRMFSQNNLPHTVEMFSDEFFSAWREARQTTDVFGRAVTLGGPISFCYIDGNHTYEFAKRDFENTDAFLEPGGFILFDDSGDGSGWEVVRVIEEVKASGRYEVVASNPNYLMRKL